MSRDSNQAVYFNCQLCGECCSSWNIPIETHKAERLLEKPWVQARLESTRRTLSRQSAEIYRIPLTDENVCVFLGEDRRCLIEVNEGLALKPHECQRFPFATVRMPDGTAIHDTSAACKSISEKLLLAFQPILPKNAPEIAGPAQEPIAPFHASDAWLEDVGEFPAKVWLTPFKKTGWQNYLALRASWRCWFQDDSLTAEEALANVQAAFNNQTGLKTVGKRKGFSEKALAIYFLRKPYRTLSLLSLLREGSYHDPRLFGEAIDLRAQGQVRWNMEQERHLKAFLYNLLCRNRLLSVGGSGESLLAMAGIAALLVRWYAKALASLQGETETSEKDVATAIRLVERYYTGHQPRFFNVFLSRFKGWLILKLLAI